MLKRLLAFLIFLSLTVPLAAASTSSTTTCPSSSTSSSTSLKLQISALYPNPNTGESEWIELQNTDTQTLDLSLYTLEDATAHPWALTGTLEAGEQVQVSGFTFQLNNSNETVTLKTSSGTQVDTWTYATSTKGVALTRNETDTEASSTTTTTDTTANSTTSPLPSSTPSRWPSFSEALPNPAGSDSESEWIELYNPYTESISLDGLKLDDEEGGSSPHSLSGNLAGESYLLLSVTESKLTLNNTEDHLRLLGVNNEILWDISYSNVQEGQSYALLNGTYEWTDNPTPNEENAGSSIAEEISSEQNTSNEEAASNTQYQNGDLSEEVTVTEVFPNPEGPDNEEEWIELTNGSDTAIHLGNWSITDASGRSYVFPDTTILEPGQTLVLYRTESGISLNNSKESVTLTDYTGEVMSEVSYESSEEEESYAEIQVEAASSTQASTSGLGNPSFSTWQWVDPSPGTKNPIWKQVRGSVSDWDGEFLTLFDGLSQWTFEANNTENNALIFQTGNTILVEASMVNGIYRIMHSELLQSASQSQNSGFPWGWLLSGLALAGWGGYEVYKKRKKVWTFIPEALN